MNKFEDDVIDFTFVLVLCSFILYAFIETIKAIH